MKTRKPSQICTRNFDHVVEPQISQIPKNNNNPLPPQKKTHARISSQCTKNNPTRITKKKKFKKNFFHHLTHKTQEISQEDSNSKTREEASQVKKKLSDYNLGEADGDSKGVTMKFEGV
jgi:hypothetical protein